MPPKAAAEVAVLASTEAAGLPEEPTPDAVELPEEPELLQPAASKIEPTAAAAATIAFDARKCNLPLPALKGYSRAGLSVLARQVSILINQGKRMVAGL
jgi:hypothetical protein